MDYAIVDVCYPVKSENLGLSSTYIKWELNRRGIQPVHYSKADVIFFSLQHPLEADKIKSYTKLNKNAVVICGGAASTSPSYIGKRCDAVVVGDGQQFFDVLFKKGLVQALKLPNIWIEGETRRVEIDNNFPWDMPNIYSEDGSYKVYLGRGCKKKCLFCQTGWGYRYSENPNTNKLLRQIKSLKNSNKKVSYMSNDLMQHTFYNKLPTIGHGSYSVDWIKKNGLPKARQIRLGVEGVSERLRKAVGKPISNADLYGCTKWLNENGKSVRYFMIAGLPGETDQDYDELKNVIQKWKLNTPKGVLALSFTAFCPDPATPLSKIPIDNDYYKRFENFKEWFFGIGWSNRLKLMKCQQLESRNKKAMASMDMEIRDIGVSDYYPNDRLLYPYFNQSLKVVEKYKNVMGIK